MPFVEYFGIGAPRSGTSWIAKCLDEHPDLAIPIKETHHFSRDREFGEGIAVYEDRIRAKWDGKGRVGEFCPNYLGIEKSAARLYDYNPDAPLIAILRNPIDRAFSHFLFEARHEQVRQQDGILTYLDSRHEYLTHGYYHAALQRYLGVGFAREQLLVLFYEDVKAQPIPAYQQILAHLGVDSHFVPPSMRETVNETRVPRIRAVERAYDIVDRAFSSPRTLKIRQAIARTGLPDKVRKLNAADVEPELTIAERLELRDRFAADVDALVELLGRAAPWSDF